MASGLYYLGIPIGAGLSLVVASLVSPISSLGWPGMSWRTCFITLGLIGVALVGALLLIKDPARRFGGWAAASHASEAPARSPPPGVAGFWRSCQYVVRFARSLLSP